MVQMQYHACLDFVHLVEILEKACVRFVHFSKENELRSRTFSEKMGLESGWNCNITVFSFKCLTIWILLSLQMTDQFSRSNS